LTAAPDHGPAGPAAPERGDRVGLDFCGLRLAHPIVNGSGTFDAIAARRAFGDALLRAPGAAGPGSGFPFAAFVSKTITLAPRDGNPPPRLYETPGGLVNSIGLPNKGLRGYLEQDLPELARLPVPLITNVMGSTAGELCALVEALDERDEVEALELNVSCPNVSTGLDIGADPGELAAVLGEVRPRTAKPLIVKLTPNTADVAAVAQAAEEAGADAVSLINTLRAYAPHADRAGAAWLGNGTGGLSGPAIRAVALAQVRAVAARVSIPIIGMGGVQSGLHAANMLDAGATLVGVGTESFRDPAAGTRISRELDDLFAKSGDNLG
jgi:dihydroorotate dehydrogenase (NAD+) catalytic subunit